MEDKVKAYPGQVLVVDALALEQDGEILAIRSTYLDTEFGKMPVEYESIQEAIDDSERYGSVWLNVQDIGTVQLAPRDLERYLGL